MKTEQSDGMMMFEVKKKTIITVNRCKQRQMICKWTRTRFKRHPRAHHCQ